MIGTKLAQHEITSHLGTGGMGEVYQAADARFSGPLLCKTAHNANFKRFIPIRSLIRFQLIFS